VVRESTKPEWELAVPVGNVTNVTLDISKDNVQFGVRAVDKKGHHSPAGFPVPSLQHPRRPSQNGSSYADAGVDPGPRS
jgi:hypothetical protein